MEHGIEEQMQYEIDGKDEQFGIPLAEDPEHIGDLPARADSDGRHPAVSLAFERLLCIFLHFILSTVYMVLAVLGHYDYFYIGPFYVDENGKSRRLQAVSFAISTVPQIIGLLYTAVLVGFTQRLALRIQLMTYQRLVATHDKAGAWFGLGACAGALWRQFRVRSSVGGIVLITLYLVAVTVVHAVTGSIFGLERTLTVENCAVEGGTSNVYLFINVNSSAVGMVATGCAMIFAALLTRSIPPRDRVTIAKEADQLYSFGLLQVIRLVSNKTMVQRRIRRAKDSSELCLREAADFTVQLMGADARGDV